VSVEVKVPNLPPCDIHLSEKGTEVMASFDAKTRLGPWANLCEACFAEHGIGLGTGLGQRLVLAERPAEDR
jgi:hypothetical protein